MRDKLFLQIVAILALVATLVFLFFDPKEDRIMVAGSVFVVATLLSLFVGRFRKGGGSE